MKPIEKVNAICSECARKLGFVPKSKVVGVWMDVCEACDRDRPCTNLWHDWERKSLVEQDEKELERILERATDLADIATCDLDMFASELEVSPYRDIVSDISSAIDEIEKQVEEQKVKGVRK